MLNFWLDQPIWLMFLLLVLGFGTMIVAIRVVTLSRWTRTLVASLTGIVAPFFSSLAVLLALLTGFVANDTWEHQKQAGRVVQSESDNVLAVYDLSIAAAPDMSAIRDALRAYVTAVIKDEWPRMGHAESSRIAADALGVLLQRVAQPQIATDAGAPTQAALLASVLNIRHDRGERLAINQHHSDDTKWLVLLILGALTQVAIGAVHLEKPRAQLAALLIFTTGLVSTLGLIAIHEWPFDGPAAIKPKALIAAAARIAEPPPAPPAAPARP